MNIRINIEIDIIGRMGFPTYFFDCLGFCLLRQRKKKMTFRSDLDAAWLPVRHVAYCLEITDADPIDLLSERFFNPTRNARY